MIFRINYLHKEIVQITELSVKMKLLISITANILHLENVSDVKILCIFIANSPKCHMYITCQNCFPDKLDS